MVQQMLFRKIICILLIVAAIACVLIVIAIQKDDVKNCSAGWQQSFQLTDEQFVRINKLQNQSHFREALNNILIPRVVGTEGHTKVKNYLTESLENLGWTIEKDIFKEEVPIFGQLEFQNIVATLNPNAKRFLILACHYDSKYMPRIKFVGATDSAVPCAMLLNMAYDLKDEFKAIKHENHSLIFVFFDGEEAFGKWGPNDSIHGAKHLVKKWKNESFIEKLDMLVLLDLLGAPDPQFPSYFDNTKQWYTNLMTIETDLAYNGMLEMHANSGVIPPKPNKYFTLIPHRPGYIEDDHIPFQKLDVPILHLIPLNFPDVWHTENDNLNIVDFQTVENLNRILRVFVMKYLLHCDE